MHAHDTEDLAKASDALQSGKVDEIVIADDETHTHGDTMRKGPVKKATTSSWSLPEGVEGVFEPSVAGTRLQGGQSVRDSSPIGRADHAAIPKSSSSIDGGSALCKIHGSSPTKYSECIHDSR